MSVKQWVRPRARRLATVAALAVAVVAAGAGAAHADPAVSGGLHVGGTVTITDEHGCDLLSATLQIRRPLSETTSAAVTTATGQFFGGQPVVLSAVIPATDNLGTPLTPGTVLVAALDGICNAFGDQFGAELGEVEFVLGEAPDAPSTTQPAPAPTTAPATAGGTAPADLQPDPAPAVSAAAGEGATLPRTGGEGVAALIGAACVAAGAALRRSARPARAR